MKFFLFSLLTFMLAGVLLRRLNPQRRSMALAALTAGVCIGYYFLRQI